MKRENVVRNWKGKIVGYFCMECYTIVRNMQDDICKHCKDIEKEESKIKTRKKGVKKRK